jgi:glycosyltransferase involved in cell wall biosynthesis
MSALIIPAYIKTQWDINCLDRLLDSVQGQTEPFEKVYLVDDASPLKYKPRHQFVDYIMLDKNGGPARARNKGITQVLELDIQMLFLQTMTVFLTRIGIAA